MWVLMDVFNSWRVTSQIFTSKGIHIVDTYQYDTLDQCRMKKSFCNLDMPNYLPHHPLYLWLIFWQTFWWFSFENHVVSLMTAWYRANYICLCTLTQWCEDINVNISSLSRECAISSGSANSIKWKKHASNKVTSRFTRSKTAATKPLPIEKALKTDMMTILAVYQQWYSNTN